jgi:hypothetical protein
LLDFYHANHYDQEFWQPARYSWHGGLDYDIHDPYTDVFNRRLVATYGNSGGLPANHPNGKDGMVFV